MKQRSITGGLAPDPNLYCVYKDPKGDYQSVVERFCLREKQKKTGKENRILKEEGDKYWKEIKGNQEKIKEFLKLKPGEKGFVRYDKNGVPLKSKSAKAKSTLPAFFNPIRKNPKTDSTDSPPKSEPVAISEPVPSSTKPIKPISIPDAIEHCDKDGAQKIAVSFTHNKILKLLTKLCPKLITKDVVENNASFTEAISRNADVILEYVKLYEEHKELVKRSRVTNLSKLNEDVQEKLAELTNQMKMASSIVLVDIPLHKLSAKAKEKQALLTQIVAGSCEVANSIKSTTIIQKLKKRLQQKNSQSATKQSLKNAMDASNLELKCLNSSIAWNDAFTRLDNGEARKDKNLDLTKIRGLASVIESGFCLYIHETPITPNEIDAILENFPVIYFSNKGKGVLVDLHELLFERNCLSLLLTGEEEQPIEVTTSVSEPKVIKPTPVYGPKRKPGRKPLWEKFPTLIEAATEFIKSHSFKAHVRRRETTGTGNGVTLKQIRKHLLENVPGLSDHGIAIDTVHLLTVGPRKNSSRYYRYKGLVDARVLRKRNDYREDSVNQHFLFARIGYREEFVVKHHNEANFFSCDDMNKLRMGPATAVSRYHQQFRFFMQNDGPNVNDHDFPNPGYLLVPSGYLQLLPKKSEETASSDHDEDIMDEPYDVIGNETTNANEIADVGETESISNRRKDKLGRAHYQRLEAGPGLIRLRACKYDTSTGQTHSNDILPILSSQLKNDRKGVAFLKVDNGSDWNLHSLVNSVYLCRVFKDSKLDVFGIVSYAAKYSAFNNIEHLWSPMSKLLSSVILPSVLEGDADVPYKLTHLWKAQIQEKEEKVFDQAMELVASRYWGEAEFNGSLITVRYKPCLDQETPYHDYAVVHKLLSGPLTNLRASKNLMEELRFMLKHVDRKSNELIFMKCVNPRCKHCSNNPIVSKNAWNDLKAQKFKWRNPIDSKQHPHHYMTFLEMNEAGSDEKVCTGDDGLPERKSVGSCPYCPSWVFMSKTEKQRHLSVFHHDKRGDGNPIWKKEFKCNYKDCGLIFPNQNKLKEHKTKSQHLQRKRKKQNQTEPKRKQLRIDEMNIQRTENIAEEKDDDVETGGGNIEMQAEETGGETTEGEEDEEVEDEEENEEEDFCFGCERARPPAVTDDDDLAWIQCEQPDCEKWYHKDCMPVKSKAKRIANGRKWFCCI